MTPSPFPFARRAALVPRPTSAMAGAPHIPVGISSVGARDDHSIFDEHVDEDLSIQFSLRPEQHLPQTSHEGGGTRVKMELDHADPSMFEGFAAYSAPFGGRLNYGDGASIFHQHQHAFPQHNSASHPPYVQRHTAPAASFARPAPMGSLKPLPSEHKSANESMLHSMPPHHRPHHPSFVGRGGGRCEG